MDTKCAYCGVSGIKFEREHVVPSCLYPASKTGSKVQRITVPACPTCNRSWADDEAHFRTVVVLASEPNQASRDVWLKAQRSFGQVDGQRRLRDLAKLLEPVEIDGTPRLKVYPGKDERVLRVVRKIVRGLSYYHGQ